VSALLLLALSATAPDPVRVASKTFTESVILGELVTEVLQHRGIPASTCAIWAVRGWSGMRWCGVTWTFTPEYTGTLAEEIFAGRVRSDALGPALAAAGVELGPALGFENGYALGMREDVADRLGIRRISDLRPIPDCASASAASSSTAQTAGARCSAPMRCPSRRSGDWSTSSPTAASAPRALDVVDLYSTDPEIQAERLRVLEDDPAPLPPNTGRCCWCVPTSSAGCRVPVPLWSCCATASTPGR
jgi:osmoprotectant transport system permease protein